MLSWRDPLCTERAAATPGSRGGIAAWLNVATSAITYTGAGQLAKDDALKYIFLVSVSSATLRR